MVEPESLQEDLRPLVLLEEAVGDGVVSPSPWWQDRRIGRWRGRRIVREKEDGGEDGVERMNIRVEG